MPRAPGDTNRAGARRTRTVQNLGRAGYKPRSKARKTGLGVAKRGSGRARPLGKTGKRRTSGAI